MNSPGVVNGSVGGGDGESNNDSNQGGARVFSKNSRQLNKGTDDGEVRSGSGDFENIVLLWWR